MKQIKKLRRYEMREGKGGKMDRYFVWDNERKQLKRGQMQKAAALELARRLNPRKRERVDVKRNYPEPTWWEKWKQRIKAWWTALTLRERGKKWRAGRKKKHLYEDGLADRVMESRLLTEMKKIEKLRKNPVQPHKF